MIRMHFCNSCLCVFTGHSWLCRLVGLRPPSCLRQAAPAAFRPWKDGADAYQHEQLQLHLEELNGTATET